MDYFKRNRIITTLSLIAGLSVAPFLICGILFLTPDTVPAGIIGEVITLIVFITCFIASRILSNEYEMKYLNNKKELKAQLDELLSHFETLPKKDKKCLIKDAKKGYYRMGKVLGTKYPIGSSILKKPEEQKVLLRMIETLLAGIDNGEGWHHFIKVYDTGAFTYKRFDGENTREDALDGWEVLSLVGCFLFPRGMHYMAQKIFVLCDFTYFDTGISEEYTEKLDKAKKEITEIYNPILFSYKEDIEKVHENIKSSIERMKAIEDTSKNQEN